MCDHVPCGARRWGGASTNAAASDESSDEEEDANRTMRVNNEIKRNLTQILLDVTDALFGTLRNLDTITVHGFNTSGLILHGPSPQSLHNLTCKAKAIVAIPLLNVVCCLQMR